MKIFIPLLALIVPAAADTLRTANVTAAVNEVQVYPGSSSPHAASIGEKVALPSSVQTGRQSRTELTFNDSTITRLGQNSVFSFREGGRNVELKQGSVLLQVPKNVGGATIRTATVTAAITGTTVMFEYNPGKWIKLLTLEGTQHLSINGSKTSVSVPAGKMIIMHPNATVIPEPVTIDIAKLVATSPLAGQGTFGPLPARATELIQQTIQEQLVAKRQGDLLPTNHVISGAGNRNSRGILDSVGDRTPPPRKPNSVDNPNGQGP
ncbi:MAG: FecR family protein [Luteolibacter sp.]